MSAFTAVITCTQDIQSPGSGTITHTQTPTCAGAGEILVIVLEKAMPLEDREKKKNRPNLWKGKIILQLK